MNIAFKLVGIIAGGVISLSSYAVDCSGIDEWAKKNIYTKGMEAKHNKVAYQAKWWTQGDNPKTNQSVQYPVWKVLGNCGTGTPPNPPPSGNVGSTDIRPTRNNANSIISIIKDDGFYTTTKLWCDYMKVNNIDGRITEGLITNKVIRNNSWQKWRDLYNTGCLDIANHSFSHKNPKNISSAELEKEVNSPIPILERELPQAGKIVLYVVPYGNVKLPALQSKVKEKHWSMKGGYNYMYQYNTLNPTGDGWYKLFQKQTTNAKDSGQTYTTTLNDLKGWVNDALREDKFLIISTHSCGDSAWGALSCDTWKKFFQFLGTKNKSDYWFEGVGKVTKYVRQRQTATVTPTVVNGDKITVNLTDTLPNDTFDSPLLLRTVIPNGWGQARVKQGNGSAVVVSTSSSGGKKYIYYEATPDRGKIVITRL